MIKDTVHTIKIINKKELDVLDLKVMSGTFGKWIELNINKARKIKAIKKIVLVYNKKDIKLAKSLKLKNVKLILGGKNRQKSAFNALK